MGAFYLNFKTSAQLFLKLKELKIMTLESDYKISKFGRKMALVIITF